MENGGYKLVWSDEFDGARLNPEVWGYELGYIRNNELQDYTADDANVYLKDGCLVIESIKTGDPKRPYTSGSVNTLGKKEFLYGRIEMRAKLPFGKGIWPAFWTLGVDIAENPWPACGEIDIMELIGGAADGFGTVPQSPHTADNVVQATIHYPNEVPLNRACELLDADYCDDFHIIGMEWTPSYIKMYVDGYVYNKLDIRERPEFHRPHYILLNTAVGGGWPGDPDDTTVFPQRYTIDWVRHYQKEG